VVVRREVIVYQQDFGGGEYYDLFAVPSSGGAPVNLTNSPDVSETSPRFSPDGKLLALDYKLKSSPANEIAVFDWSSRAVRNLTNEKAKTTPGRSRHGVRTRVRFWQTDLTQDIPTQLRS